MSIAGDPAAVEAAAATIEQAGTTFSDTSDDIASHGREVTADWTGFASVAAGAAIKTLSVRTAVGADVCARAAAALRNYAGELRAAQADYATATAAAASAATATEAADTAQVSAATMQAATPDQVDAKTTATAAATAAAADAQSAATAAVAAVSDATTRADTANTAAADLIDTLTDQLAAMDGTGANHHRDKHGAAYNMFGGFGNAAWSIGPGFIGDILEWSGNTNDREVSNELKEDHDWLENWYGADTDSRAYRGADTTVQIASIFVPGEDFAKVGQGVVKIGELAKGAETAESAVEGAEVASSRPQWLRDRMASGTAWHLAQQERLVATEPGTLTEVQVVKPGDPKPAANGRIYPNRVDAYNPKMRRITSMKETQLAAVEPSTAKAYIRELATKYSPGTPIAKTPKNDTNTLIEKNLEGQMYLLVPQQTEPIPAEILQYAKEQNVKIIQAPEGS